MTKLVTFLFCFLAVTQSFGATKIAIKGKVPKALAEKISVHIRSSASMEKIRGEKSLPFLPEGGYGSKWTLSRIHQIHPETFAGETSYPSSLASILKKKLNAKKEVYSLSGFTYWPHSSPTNPVVCDANFFYDARGALIGFLDFGGSCRSLSVQRNIERLAGRVDPYDEQAEREAEQMADRKLRESLPPLKVGPDHILRTEDGVPFYVPAYMARVTCPANYHVPTLLELLERLDRNRTEKKVVRAEELQRERRKENLSGSERPAKFRGFEHNFALNPDGQKDEFYFLQGPDGVDNGDCYHTASRTGMWYGYPALYLSGSGKISTGVEVSSCAVVCFEN